MSAAIRNPEREYDVWACPECGHWWKDQGVYPGTCARCARPMLGSDEDQRSAPLLVKLVLVPREGAGCIPGRHKAPAGGLR